VSNNAYWDPRMTCYNLKHILTTLLNKTKWASSPILCQKMIEARKRAFS
jgi:hypothetical protein